MKKHTITTVLISMILFWGSFVRAQEMSSPIDQRLIDVYGIERVQQMSSEQPQFVSYMNYYVRNGYQILTDVPARKLPYFEDISTITNTRTGKAITVNDFENLNILLLDIKRKNDEYLTYKVGETGTVIVFIAPKNLLEEYKVVNDGEGGK